MTRRQVLGGALAGAAAGLAGPRAAEAQGGNRRRCEAAEFIQPREIPEENRWTWDLHVPKDAAGVPGDKHGIPQSGAAPMYSIKPKGYIRTDDIRAVAEDPGKVVDTIYENADGTGEATKIDPPLGYVKHGIAPEFWGDLGRFEPKMFWDTCETFAYYDVRIRTLDGQIIPPVRVGGEDKVLKTPLWGYNGQVPGPTFRGPALKPIVVRFTNELETETSVHLHGAHSPAHSDGHPAFLIEPRQARDYFYPMGVPKVAGTVAPGGDPWDMGECVSTMWYHDHANDITAHNALLGLSGFSLVADRHEQGLIDAKKLPAEAQDIPIVLQDRCIRRDGRLHFDPFDHNGYLGNITLCNGRAYPRLKVKPWKYRFRFLDGALARMYRVEFRLEDTLDVEPRMHEHELDPNLRAEHPERHDDASSPALPFVRIGKDSWLFPKGLEGHRSVFLGMAGRGDIIFDFAPYKGKTLYLVNTLAQQDGRGPGHVEFADNEDDPDNLRGDIDNIPLRRKTDDPREKDHQDDKHVVVRLLKIEVGDDAEPDPCTYDADTVSPLREHEDLRAKYLALSEAERAKVPTREFVFERRKGAWQVNHQFFDEERVDAVPSFAGHDGGLERWILRNKSGGWWHPIHIHLESHQHLRQSRTFERSVPDAPGGGVIEERERKLPELDKFKHDTTILGPNMTVEILMRFRTFFGPFVFHCHNLNHEDMRMMQTFDPRGELSLSPRPIDPGRWYGEPLGREGSISGGHS